LKDTNSNGDGKPGGRGNLEKDCYRNGQDRPKRTNPGFNWKNLVLGTLKVQINARQGLNRKWLKRRGSVNGNILFGEERLQEEKEKTCFTKGKKHHLGEKNEDNEGKGTSKKGGVPAGLWGGGCGVFWGGGVGGGQRTSITRPANKKNSRWKGLSKRHQALSKC